MPSASLTSSQPKAAAATCLARSKSIEYTKAKPLQQPRMMASPSSLNSADQMKAGPILEA